MMRAPFKGEVYCIPKKKKALNPKIPMMPSKIYIFQWILRVFDFICFCNPNIRTITSAAIPNRHAAALAGEK
ncbi:hypothetical protein PMEGAS228_33430 [Priestia megaterium]|nr:Uncharacterised protein [Priestia megaterium]